MHHRAVYIACKGDNMRWASYEGVLRFPKNRWKNEQRWHCVAYWNDEAAHCPAELRVTTGDLSGGRRLSEAHLRHVEGLAGSRPRFASERLSNSVLTQRRSKVSLNLVFEGFRGDRLIFSGTWCEISSTRLHSEEAIELEADLTNSGIGNPTDEIEKEVAERCSVQHVALQLEPLLKRLADREKLGSRERGNLRASIEEYLNGSCGTQQCRQSSCALRVQHDWLTFLRYQDVRDVLDYKKSGLSELAPRLLFRKGVETLAMTHKRRPGNYNP